MIALTVDEAQLLGYRPARIMPDGSCAGVMRMNFTWGLFVDITEECNGGRYCYGTREDAEAALYAWDGVGDPPGLWIKRKVYGKSEALGPGFNK